MAVIVRYGRGGEAQAARGAGAHAVQVDHGGREGRAGVPGRGRGVREVEGRAGKACKHARAAGDHAGNGTAGRLYGKAERNAGWLLLLMLGLVLLMAVSWGQACQRAYLDGQAYATANAKAEADATAYDKGYADAVYAYREGTASWAR